MKKSISIGSLLGACIGAASAQSSVALFGVIDLGVRAVKNGDGGTVASLTGNGLSTSRWGLRGTEDLGGGIKAGFWLESAIGADTGTAGSSNSAAAGNGAMATSKFFDRRATLGLSGAAGEVRLGRDYTPTFSNLSAFDAYGSTGFAGEANLLGGGSPTAVGTLGSGAGTLARADNSVGYFLPRNAYGIYGTAMAAAGEGSNTSNGNNRYVGARIGWRSGALDMAGAYGRTRIPNDSDFRVWNAGASYGTPAVKLLVLYHQADFTPAGLPSRSQKLWVLGAKVPAGPGEFRATYQRSAMRGGTAPGLRDQDGARQFALGYVYHLSKRTALYTDAGRIQNRGRSSRTFTGGTTAGSNFGTVDNRNSTAFVLGVRHNF
ncbi:porin [Xylophilus sp.]|uniref:porin n=1 Tax=Xylophilus sp. TaxID=2653893 RepID=UPI0013BA6853|nr:porin [Xylophilus sp.]KAF1046446.1 MAG: Outer membrane porin protein 32 [Xylophilus sp.]